MTFKLLCFLTPNYSLIKNLYSKFWQKSSTQIILFCSQNIVRTTCVIKSLIRTTYDNSSSGKRRYLRAMREVYFSSSTLPVEPGGRLCHQAFDTEVNRQTLSELWLADEYSCGTVSRDKINGEELFGCHVRSSLILRSEVNRLLQVVLILRSTKTRRQRG